MIKIYTISPIKQESLVQNKKLQKVKNLFHFKVPIHNKINKIIKNVHKIFKSKIKDILQLFITKNYIKLL